MPKTFSIDNVEIFAAGTWNGDTYTVQDLDEMVKAFSENKDKIRPFLKLGHDNGQKLLQNDGLPAAGWISDLKRQGNKLVATFSDVPRKIFELIKNKAYRKVSSEIYWNIELNGKSYSKFLSAVALLGSDMPAVTSLDSILGMFNHDAFATVKSYASDENTGTLKEYQFATEGKGDDMSEETLKKLGEAEAKLKDMEAKQKQFTKDLDEAKKSSEKKDSELTELREYKKEQDAKNAELAEKAAKAERESQFAELEKSGLPVSSKEYVIALLKEDKKEYSFKDKKFKKFELLGEILKLYKEALGVNFDESSIKGDESSQKDAALEAKLEKYAKENKCSYAEAVKAIGYAG